MQLVLDTNIVLDLLVFGDPQVQAVSSGLATGSLHWLATGAMREELVHDRLAAREPKTGEHPFMRAVLEREAKRTWP